MIALRYMFFVLVFFTLPWWIFLLAIYAGVAVSVKLLLEVFQREAA